MNPAEAIVGSLAERGSPFTRNATRSGQFRPIPIIAPYTEILNGPLLSNAVLYRTATMVGMGRG